MTVCAMNLKFLSSRYFFTNFPFYSTSEKCGNKKNILDTHLVGTYTVVLSSELPNLLISD